MLKVNKISGPSTYAKHLGSKPIQAIVSTEVKKALSTPGETEVLVPGLFDTNGMLVTIEGSHTINLGDFNSARIGVSLTIPCSPQTLQDAYDWGLQWCSDRITKEVNKAKGL